MKRRRVKIEQSILGGCWNVVYLDRKKHQRWQAANFYMKDHSLVWVVNWVLRNPKLELSEVEAPVVQIPHRFL